MRTILLVLIIGVLTLFTFQNGFVVGRQIFRDMRFILQNPQLSYDDKMRIYWWGVYDLLQFVNKQTSNHAKILIPPQQRPYLTSGNAGIVSYFIYPREPIPSTFETRSLEKANYVLITHGEWEDAPIEKYDWPKEKIKAKEVIYFNPKTKEETILAGDYDPVNKNKFGFYGLIVLDEEGL